MAKPDTPGELRDVEVKAVSLVGKAANKQKFAIFKSADYSEGGNVEMREDAREKKLFDVIKAFFIGEDIEIEKGDLEDAYNAKEKARKLSNAIDSLWATLNLNRWGDQSKKTETDPKKIRSVIEDFKKIAEEILLGKDADLVKVAAEVEKSGRKISGARLTELKAAHSALSKIIEDADGNADAEGEKRAGNEVTKEELLKIVKDGIDEGTKPLIEKLEQLEKSDTPGKEGDSEVSKTQGNTEPEIRPSDIAEIVKNAVSETTASLAERLEKVEKARGVSNRIPEDANVNKSASIFGGVFTSD